MDTSFLSGLLGILYIALIIVFSVYVVMQRHPVGVTLAWLLLMFVLPVAGFAFYLLLGSRRLGLRRLKRLKSYYPDYAQWSSHLSRVITQQRSSSPDLAQHKGVCKLAEQTLAVPVLPCQKIHLYHTTDSILSGLIDDIGQAKKSIVMEFYICQPEGRIRLLVEALMSAAGRGVACTIILDGVGSRDFLRGEWAGRFRLAGISVVESMPVGLLRVLFERVDIRNHRKIMVVDDQIGWSGSFNLIDPALFKQQKSVGEWVDAMVRVEGIPAHVMATIAYWDKTMETGITLSSFTTPYELPRSMVNDVYKAHVHLLPSGPGTDRERLHQVLLTAVYESEKELLMSTPYFVPDESLLTALKSAAMRGVDVQLLLPCKNDSRMVHHASRSYYDELLKAGVKIQHFTGGLLHTKCVLADRSTVLFGTVNLDMRSVWLNYEVTMIVYDRVFGETVADLFEHYLTQSKPVCQKVWSRRPFSRRLLENVFQILSPLL